MDFIVLNKNMVKSIYNRFAARLTYHLDYSEDNQNKSRKLKTILLLVTFLSPLIPTIIEYYFTSELMTNLSKILAACSLKISPLICLGYIFVTLVILLVILFLYSIPTLLPPGYFGYRVIIYKNLLKMSEKKSLDQLQSFINTVSPVYLKIIEYLYQNRKLIIILIFILFSLSSVANSFIIPFFYLLNLVIFSIFVHDLLTSNVGTSLMLTLYHLQDIEGVLLTTEDLKLYSDNVVEIFRVLEKYILIHIHADLRVNKDLLNTLKEHFVLLALTDGRVLDDTIKFVRKLEETLLISLLNIGYLKFIYLVNIVFNLIWKYLNSIRFEVSDFPMNFIHTTRLIIFSRLKMEILDKISSRFLIHRAITVIMWLVVLVVVFAINQLITQGYVNFDEILRELVKISPP